MAQNHVPRSGLLRLRNLKVESIGKFESIFETAFDLELGHHLDSFGKIT
jgi:hypothetical protein